MPSPEPRVPRLSAAPQLPPMTETTTVSYRHEVNPALATNLLNELQIAVGQQQQQLRRIIRQIKGLYAEGPVVNGWLESSADAAEKPLRSAESKSSGRSDYQASRTDGEPIDPSVLFRHGDVEDLMAYVQAMEPESVEGSAISPDSVHPDEHETTTVDPAIDAQYRLCQLDRNGQVRSQLCPPEQVPTVSMAIVRHQKLVKLVARKRTIEGKLKQVVETLESLKALFT